VGFRKNNSQLILVHLIRPEKEKQSVSKFISIALTALAIMLLATPAMAADANGSFGAGLVVIGAALGIGKLAGSALESMARQPEAAAAIQVAMIIAAALIEGFTFYALYICSTGV
jgi:F-type H+-transporting ATPase subunit c